MVGKYHQVSHPPNPNSQCPAHIHNASTNETGSSIRDSTRAPTPQTFWHFYDLRSCRRNLYVTGARSCMNLCALHALCLSRRERSSISQSLEEVLFSNGCDFRGNAPIAQW